MSDGTGIPAPPAWLLPSERAPAEALAAQIALAASSPLVGALLGAVGAAAAVLNDRCQVVAVNAGFLEALGVDDPEAVLGLRPGEAIRCSRAHDNRGGCGRGLACASCGAAVAMLAALASGRPEERDGVLTVRQGREAQDVDLRVRASPVLVGGERLLLLALTDVTAARRRAALERAVLGEVSGLAAGLGCAAAALGSADPAAAAAAAADVRELAGRLARELQLQRALATARPGAVRVAVERVPVPRLVERLAERLRHHPAAAGRTLLAPPPPDVALETDPFLLSKVLATMVQNALEATGPGGEVRLDVRLEPEAIAFRAWNAGAIPSAVVPRLFQRHFTTKGGEGRGQGTFLLRLLGERYLEGRVAVATTAEGGTAFELTLPRSIATPPPLGSLAR
jgi:signal transduction histidine kinase